MNHLCHVQENIYHYGCNTWLYVLQKNVSSTETEWLNLAIAFGVEGLTIVCFVRRRRTWQRSSPIVKQYRRVLLNRNVKRIRLDSYLRFTLGRRDCLSRHFWYIRCIWYIWYIVIWLDAIVNMNTLLLSICLDFGGRNVCAGNAFRVQHVLFW